MEESCRGLGAPFVRGVDPSASVGMTEGMGSSGEVREAFYGRPGRGRWIWIFFSESQIVD